MPWRCEGADAGSRGGDSVRRRSGLGLIGRRLRAVGLTHRFSDACSPLRKHSDTPRKRHLSVFGPDLVSDLSLPRPPFPRSLPPAQLSQTPAEGWRTRLSPVALSSAGHPSRSAFRLSTSLRHRSRDSPCADVPSSLAPSRRPVVCLSRPRRAISVSRPTASRPQSEPRQCACPGRLPRVSLRLSLPVYSFYRSGRSCSDAPPRLPLASTHPAPVPGRYRTIILHTNPPPVPDPHARHGAQASARPSPHRLPSQ